jgi:hypothetical protein
VEESSRDTTCSHLFYVCSEGICLYGSGSFLAAEKDLGTFTYAIKFRSDNVNDISKACFAASAEEFEW